jgi:lysophosphatidic acid acyltransferase/lysophosphatidylinositol acyltransferase
MFSICIYFLIFFPFSLTDQDALLERYFCKDSFSDLQQQDIGRPIKSLFVRYQSHNLNKSNVIILFLILFCKQVVISWICLLVYCIVIFFQWSSLLSSWEGIAFSAIFLVLVTIVMQILIQSSESEGSTPVSILPQDLTEEEKLLQK